MDYYDTRHALHIHHLDQDLSRRDQFGRAVVDSEQHIIHHSPEVPQPRDQTSASVCSHSKTDFEITVVHRDQTDCHKT
jgi:hypothetical protein